MARKVRLELTLEQAQGLAYAAGVAFYSDDDARSVFVEPQGRKAAARAVDKLSAAIRAAAKGKA